MSARNDRARERIVRGLRWPWQQAREIAATSRYASQIAEGLEHAAWQGELSRALSGLWRALARPARPLQLPKGAYCIGVGGTTLGGSGKTPVAVALARAIDAAGQSAALVCHGHTPHAATRAWLRSAGSVQVTLDHTSWQVGDEASEAARRLADWPTTSARAYVAATRQKALEHAANAHDFVILDGVLQSAPTRLARAILVRSCEAPWATAACPPAGDLRADHTRLLRAADVQLVLHSHAEGAASSWCRAHADAPPSTRNVTHPHPALHAYCTLLTEPHWHRERIGVLLPLARPERVLHLLGAAAVRPITAVRAAPHSQHDLSRELQRQTELHRIERWLVPERGRQLLRDFRGPWSVLQQQISLPTLEELLGSHWAAHVRQ